MKTKIVGPIVKHGIKEFKEFKSEEKDKIWKKIKSKKT